MSFNEGAAEGGKPPHLSDRRRRARTEPSDVFRFLFQRKPIQLEVGLSGGLAEGPNVRSTCHVRYVRTHTRHTYVHVRAYTKMKDFVTFPKSKRLFYEI